MIHYIFTNYKITASTDQVYLFEESDEFEKDFLNILSYNTDNKECQYLTKTNVIVNNPVQTDIYKIKCKDLVDSNPSYNRIINEIKDQKVLFLIHGIKCPPARFLNFIDLIEERYIKNTAQPFNRIILIAWNSLGSYNKSRAKAEVASSLFSIWLCNLGIVLEESRSFFLLCQSSGNYLLERMQLNWFNQFFKLSMKPLFFNKLFLTAADINKNLFLTFNDSLVNKFANSFHVFFNKIDFTLHLGYCLYHDQNEERMGITGANEHCNSIHNYNINDIQNLNLFPLTFESINKVEQEEVSELMEQYSFDKIEGMQVYLGHVYFIRNDGVINKIIELMNN